MTVPVEPIIEVPLNTDDFRHRSQGGSFGSIVSDLVALTKPRITMIVVATMLGGVTVANRYARSIGLPEVGAGTIILSLLGTVLVVSGANALNMYLERDTDGLMERTKKRPLPAKRLSPNLALWFGIAISLISLLILGFAVNWTTTLLGAFALFSYVLVYTPLKRKTTAALLIGAVPGAIPPLLGWTTVTDRIDAPGAVLFLILFLWQVPHFLAIALFRSGDYQRAGLKVLPAERGEALTRRHIVGYLVALLAVSLLVVPLGVAGPVYFVAALVFGVGFLAYGVMGLRSSGDVRWARGLFAVSILYLMLIQVALVVGA
ncbi:MAG: protoheme IX farnesyltransferase [Polyangiaceae bacterium]|nr:protoheme IX farnesyltransferase [Polyangiaceae bacterium]